MKSAKMLTIVVLALGLMVWPAPMAEGAQYLYLTVNGKDVTLITLELGQSCTVEVVSKDSTSYEAYVGFDNRVVLGTFSHLETKPEAGGDASVKEYNQKPFYGYGVKAARPKPGVHFIFQYEAQQVGKTDLKLYLKDPPPSPGTLLDSVPIRVIPLSPKPMGTAFTYQGSLLDADSPADGLYDFQFKLYDNPGPFAAQQGNTININDLDVIEGQFTLELDFGSEVFVGDARWLETTVAQSDGSDPATLSPRVELTPTPYAIYAKYAEAAGGDGDWRVSGNNMYSIPSGNVGIGTTNPDDLLHVWRDTSGSLGIRITNADVQGRDYALRVAGSGSAVGAGNFAIYDHTASATRLVVDSTGKVGIGTTTPQNQLDVVGRVAVGASYSGTETAPSNGMIIQGNVGIGTTNPAEKLHVAGDIRLNSGGDIAFADDNTRIHESSDDLLLEADDDIYISPDDDIRMDGSTLFVDGSANRVGIGTTSPAYKLHVNGESYFHGSIHCKLPDQILGTAVIVHNDILHYKWFPLGHNSDIKPLKDDFYRILDLEAKSFVSKKSGAKGICLSAEDLDEQGLSNLLTYEDGQPVSINYDLVSVYLLEVIKDQVSSIKELKEANESLTQRLDALERKIQPLAKGKEVQL